MSSNVKVSVVMTSYNHAKYLSQAIESVLNQTFSDFELIIFDDASTDGSEEILNGLSDPRIRIFRNKNATRGAAFFKKSFLESSNGEYIAIHHSDDMWDAQKLEKQVAFLDANLHIGAVFTNIVVIGDDDELLKEGTHPYQTVFDQHNRSRYEWLNYFFCKGNALCHPSVLIRRVCYEDCGTYRYGFSQLGDFDMWVRLCLKYDIHVLPEKLFKLRVHSNEANASADRPDSRIRRQFELLPILENFRNILTLDDLIRVFPNAEKYADKTGFDKEFVLGMMCFETETFNGNITHLFGLMLLFNALNDPERSSGIAEIYNFSQKDFVELNSRYDIFSVNVTADLAAHVQSLSTQAQSLSSQLVYKEQEILSLTERLGRVFQTLLEIQSSRAWKLTVRYREIRTKLFSLMKNRIK